MDTLIQKSLNEKQELQNELKDLKMQYEAAESGF